MRGYLWVAHVLTLSLLSGCAMDRPPASTADMPGLSDAAAPAALEASLFKSDQAVLSNGDIDKILSSRIYPPAHARIAVIRIGGRYPWGRTWWSENVAQIEQEGTDQLLNHFRKSPRVGRVMVLPTMLTPAQVTVPYLRESAARVQADLLLVYRTFTQSYQQQRFFGGGDIHAYCTVEAILLDTRSGVVIDTSVKTQSFSASKTSKDLEFEEAAARAEQKAIASALGQSAEDLARNLAAEPLPPMTQPGN